MAKHNNEEIKQKLKAAASAIEQIKEAIVIYPIWKKYYVQLYYFYKNCKVDKVAIDELKREFLFLRL